MLTFSTLSNVYEIDLARAGATGTATAQGDRFVREEALGLKCHDTAGAGWRENRAQSIE